MTPKRIRLERTAGWRMPDNTIKVDRTTKWGNPFVIGEDGSREDCLMKFRALLTSGYIVRGTMATAAAQRAFASHAAAYWKQLRGKNLACWCKPEERCHADILIEFANRPRCEDVEDEQAAT